MCGIGGDWSGVGRVHRIHTREILREHEVKCPIESDPKFLFEPRQLTKVDGTPQPPRYKPREVDAKNIGDASSAADRGELAYGRKTKSAPSPAQNDRGKIIGEYPCPKRLHPCKSATGYYESEQRMTFARGTFRIGFLEVCENAIAEFDCVISDFMVTAKSSTPGRLKKLTEEPSARTR